jgi:hypothetical protein
VVEALKILRKTGGEGQQVFDIERIARVSLAEKIGTHSGGSGEKTLLNSTAELLECGRRTGNGTAEETDEVSTWTAYPANSDGIELAVKIIEALLCR